MNLPFYRNFDLERYSSSRGSCWILGMGCGINFILTLKRAVPHESSQCDDIWLINALWIQSDLACFWNGAILSLYHVLCSLWYCISWWGEDRYPQRTCKQEGSQMQAHRASQHQWKQSLAYQQGGAQLQRKTWQTGPTGFIKEPSLHKTESTRMVTQQSHASLTSAMSRASLWLLAKHFHNVCLYKL